jgi:ATP-dependent HslUV protease ATP-binding subunit HslU
VEDFIKILTEPKSSLVKQSTALLETEGLKLEFSPESLAEIANFAYRVNEATENIGARRLHTIMERVLDEISFDAPDLARRNRASSDGKGEAVGSDATLSLAAGADTTADAKTSPTIPMVEREGANGAEKVIAIDAAYVQHMVASIVKDQDLSRYIL